MVAREQRGAHTVVGSRSLAGRLTRQHILGVVQGGQVVGAAEVFHSDSASVRRGEFTIRTKKGSAAFGRTRCDHLAYIPFESDKGVNHCVMLIDQILLVNRGGLDWRDDEGRLAVGVLYDKLSVCSGGGMETGFNDDTSRGKCVIPGALRLTASDKARRYRWAVYVNQIYCTCSCFTDKTGHIFLTSQKMGFHGRKDLQYDDED